MADHCGPGVRLRGPRACRCSVQHDVRRGRRRRQVRRRRRRKLLQHADRPRDDREPDRGVLGSGQPDDDRRPGLPRPSHPTGHASRSRGHVCHLSAQGARPRGHAERRPAVRAVRGPGRAALPVRAQDHLPQRGEPAPLPPAAVRRCRQRDLGLRAGAGDGSLLRRAEGGGSRNRRDRVRAVAARQRRLRRGEQRFALADPLPQGSRRRLSGERPDDTDRRRCLPPLLSEPQHGCAVGRLPVAEGRLRQPRPVQAGLVGRFPRHRTAALPRGG